MATQIKSKLLNRGQFTTGANMGVGKNMSGKSMGYGKGTRLQ